MNFTYFKFLFINTIKRKPVWITWLLFLFTCTCFLIILPIAAKMNTIQIWANSTMAVCQTFLGMTIAIFTAVLAINIFKDTNEEGTELIIVSKPITRIKIVLTKFILFGAFCLAVNITSCIITMFTAFLPRTEARFYWGLVISMFIGNLITFGVFGSIAILMTVKFAKVGVIVTNIALSLVFLIYQALTLFVFTTPSKALVDNHMSAPSYITTSRNLETGEYKELEFVKFVAAPEEKKKHACQATNWQEMKDFWFNQIIAIDPKTALTLTDWAGQISLTYLSVDLDEYAFRQARRMFAISRFYDCDLYSPASPELLNVENKTSLPWLYTDKTTYTTETEIPLDISIPSTVGYFAIPPTAATRLKGYTEHIPIGFIKSKELLSEREVFFEPEQWQKYSRPFKMLYDSIFDWKQYIDYVIPSLITDYSEFASLFANNTDAEQRFYQLVWHSLTGGVDSLLKDPSTGKIIYDKTYFDIITPDDLNDRFMQFKCYVFYQLLEEQQNLLLNVPTDEDVLKSWNDAKDELSTIASLLGITYTNGWMMKASTDESIVLEPNTQTIAFNLIDTAYEKEYDSVIQTLPTEEEKRDKAVASPKGVMNKTMTAFNAVVDPSERFLFDSLEKPTRNAKNTGEIHTVSDDWVPYLLTLLGPQYDPETMPDKTSSMPIGHNMSMFFFSAKPNTKFWYFAIFWGLVSLSLMAGGVVVYSKYDVK